MRQINTDNFVEPSTEGVLGLDEATALLASAEQEDADPGDAGEGEAEDADDEAETGADEDSDDVEAQADDEDSASDQEAGDEDAPDEEEPASEDDAEDEDDAPAEPVSDPPKFWSAEEKALFAKAPPELQKIISARDAEYSRQVSLAKEEAATARKEASVISDVKSAIDKQLERAEGIFKGKWDGVDFVQWAKDDANEAFAAKLEFDAEQAELEAMRTAQAATAREEHRQFVKAESVKLAEMVPELADPVKGPENKAAIVKLLTEDGFDADDIRHAGAKELKLAWEALQWRKVQTRLAQKPPKPEPAKVEKKAPGVVKPVAAAPPRKAIAQRQKTEVVTKAMRTGRMDDAVAALMALERQ